MLELVGQGSSGVKRMRLRRDGVCSCGTPVAAGTAAGWDVGARVVVCPGCLGAPDRHEVSGPPQPTQGGRRVDAAPDGRAGGSAQAEYERRNGRRERQGGGGGTGERRAATGGCGRLIRGPAASSARSRPSRNRRVRGRPERRGSGG